MSINESQQANIIEFKQADKEYQLKQKIKQQRDIGQQTFLAQDSFLKDALSTVQQNLDIRYSEKLDKLTGQVERLANTNTQIVDRLGNMSVDEENPDVCVAPIGSNPDMSTIESSLPAEVIYTITSKQIADTIGKTNGKTKLHPAQIGLLLKGLGIKGNSNFHHEFKTSEKGKCQKYKPSVIQEIYKRIKNPQQYNVDLVSIQKVIDKLKSCP